MEKGEKIREEKERWKEIGGEVQIAKRRGVNIKWTEKKERGKRKRDGEK